MTWPPPDVAARRARCAAGADAVTADDLAHLIATLDARTICRYGRPRCILPLGHDGRHLPEPA